MLMVRGALQLNSLNEFLHTGPTTRLFCRAGVAGVADSAAGAEKKESMPSTCNTRLD